MTNDLFEPDEIGMDGLMQHLWRRWSQLKAYYFNPNVKYQICRYTQKREFGYLVPTWLREHNLQGISRVSTRNWHNHTPKHFDAIMNKYIFQNYKEVIYPRLVNLYYSLAKYEDGLPFMNLDVIERKPQVEEWKKTHYSQMTSFDFLIDIDARPLNNIYFALHDAKLIKRIFDRLAVPYSFRYSGSGFHIIIPGEAMPKLSLNPLDDSSIYKFQNEILELIDKKITGMVDLTTWDSRQLCKIPYTIAFLEEGNYLSYEFRDNESIKNFFIEDFDLSNSENFAKLPKDLGYLEPYIFNRININNPGPIIEFKRYLEAKK